MKVLSLWDPWGSLMAAEKKRVETRGSWVDRVTHRGLVWIHVALKEFKPSHYPPDLLEWVERAGLDWRNLPYGKVIAVGNLVRIVKTESIRDSLSEMELAFGDYTNGRRGLIFENMRRLREPIPVKGMQGLWDWEPPEGWEALLELAGKATPPLHPPPAEPPAAIVVGSGFKPAPVPDEQPSFEDDVEDAPMPKVITGSGLLKLDVENKLRFHINHLVGEQVAILGIKGSGKSYTARLLSEAMLEYVPMTIVDIDGEYRTLKERYPDLRVLGGDYGEALGIARDVAEMSFRLGVSVVLDFSNTDQEQMFDYLVEYFERLWHLSNRVVDRKPYALLIEEAHEFVPQRRSTPIKRAINRLAGRGRKRGFTVIYVSQRAEKVDNDALTSCEIYFLHRVMHPDDIETYRAFIPLLKREVREKVVALKTGQAIVLRGAEMNTVTIRQAATTHGGATPKLKFEDAPRSLPYTANPVDVLFSELLASTVHEWGDRLVVDSECLEERHHVTVYFNGRTLRFTSPAINEEKITPRQAASALWAITALCWRHTTLEGFCRAIGGRGALKPTDPEALIKFNEFRRIARECVTLFGNFWGNEAALQQQARQQVATLGTVEPERARG